MAPYLTRIEINPRRRSSTRVLASPHRMHGAVSLCFPPSTPPGRVLWRIDRAAAGLYLYLVSAVAPDPTGFVEEHGWPATGGWATRDYAPLLDKVQAGVSFSFRLAANPVHHVRPPSTPRRDSDDDRGKGAADIADRRGGRVRGQRFAHITVAQQLTWLVSRAPGWGFSVGSEDEPTARIVERRKLVFTRNQQPVTVGLAVFEGHLTVTDAVVLRERLVSGIGAAKAYGCGMLTLAPPAP